jgi:hypothetical protein
MYCDLVGSAALSTRVDPEDLREVIGPEDDAERAMRARHERQWRRA